MTLLNNSTLENCTWAKVKDWTSLNCPSSNSQQFWVITNILSRLLYFLFQALVWLSDRLTFFLFLPVKFEVVNWRQVATSTSEFFFGKRLVFPSTRRMGLRWWLNFLVLAFIVIYPGPLLTKAGDFVGWVID